MCPWSQRSIHVVENDLELTGGFAAGLNVEEVSARGTWIAITVLIFGLPGTECWDLWEMPMI